MNLYYKAMLEFPRSDNLEVGKQEKYTKSAIIIWAQEASQKLMPSNKYEKICQKIVFSTSCTLF